MIIMKWAVSCDRHSGRLLRFMLWLVAPVWVAPSFGAHSNPTRNAQSNRFVTLSWSYSHSQPSSGGRSLSTSSLLLLPPSWSTASIQRRGARTWPTQPTTRQWTPLRMVQPEDLSSGIIRPPLPFRGFPLPGVTIPEDEEAESVLDDNDEEQQQQSVAPPEPAPAESAPSREPQPVQMIRPPTEPNDPAPWEMFRSPPLPTKKPDLMPLLTEPVPPRSLLRQEQAPEVTFRPAPPGTAPFSLRGPSSEPKSSEEQEETPIASESPAPAPPSFSTFFRNNINTEPKSEEPSEQIPATEIETSKSEPFSFFRQPEEKTETGITTESPPEPIATKTTEPESEPSKPDPFSFFRHSDSKPEAAKSGPSVGTESNVDVEDLLPTTVEPAPAPEPSSSSPFSFFRQQQEPKSRAELSSPVGEQPTLPTDLEALDPVAPPPPSPSPLAQSEPGPSPFSFLNNNGNNIKVAPKSERSPPALVDELKQPEPMIESKVDAKAETKLDAKAQTTRDSKTEMKSDSTTEATLDGKAQTKTDSIGEVQSDSKGDVKKAIKAETKTDVKTTETINGDTISAQAKTDSKAEAITDASAVEVTPKAKADATTLKSSTGIKTEAKTESTIKKPDVPHEDSAGIKTEAKAEPALNGELKPLMEQKAPSESGTGSKLLSEPESKLDTKKESKSNSKMESKLDFKSESKTAQDASVTPETKLNEKRELESKSIEQEESKKSDSESMLRLGQDRTSAPTSTSDPIADSAKSKTGLKTTTKANLESTKASTEETSKSVKETEFPKTTSKEERAIVPLATEPTDPSLVTESESSSLVLIPDIIETSSSSDSNIITMNFQPGRIFPLGLIPIGAFLAGRQALIDRAEREKNLEQELQALTDAKKDLGSQSNVAKVFFLAAILSLIFIFGTL